jgi:ATP-dependent helicase HrpA
VSLYGLPVVTGRSVSYGRIDPVVSRELFLRHALVEGDWDTRHGFVAANRARREELRDIEARVRRRGLVVDDEELFALYDARVPASVVSARHFDTWWKKARRTQPDLLTFGRRDLLRPGAGGSTGADFPDTWPLGHQGGPAQGESGAAAGPGIRAGPAALRTLPLSYHFEPGAPDDGVTLHVPVGVLPQVSAESLEWLVPGLREELVVGLLRSLPKALRRSFVPAGRFAAAALDRLEPGNGSLRAALAAELTRMGAAVSPDDFDPDRLEPHLRMTVRVEDPGGRVLAQGKDLALLQRQLAPAARASVARGAGDLERAGLTDWSVGTLPRSVEVRQGGQRVTGFPALVDERGSVAVRVLLDRGQQARAMRLGTRRLLLLTLSSPASTVVSRLDRETKLALVAAPHPSASALLEDCRAAAVDALLGRGDEQVAWDEPGFRRLQQHVADGLEDTMRELVPAVARVLESAASLRNQLDGLAAAAHRNADLAEVTADVTGQLDGLVFPGFVTATGRARLADLPRYLAGARRRLERLQAAARPVDALRRDLQQMDLVHALEDSYTEAVERLSTSDWSDARVTEVRWMLQELRVSLFAQELGTRQQVSEKRVRRALAEMSAHG